MYTINDGRKLARSEGGVVFVSIHRRKLDWFWSQGRPIWLIASLTCTHSGSLLGSDSV